MATVDQRNAALDALQSAANDLFDKEITRLDNESKFLNAVLQGRGATNVGTQNLAATSSLVFAQINSFLLGS